MSEYSKRESCKRDYFMNSSLLHLQNIRKYSVDDTTPKKLILAMH